MNKRQYDVLGAVLSVVTIFAALPYEVELIQLFPVGWKPYVVTIGALATVVTRILKAYLPAVPPVDVPPTPVQPTATDPSRVH